MQKMTTATSTLTNSSYPRCSSARDKDKHSRVNAVGCTIKGRSDGNRMVSQGDILTDIKIKRQELNSDKTAANRKNGRRCSYFY